MDSTIQETKSVSDFVEQIYVVHKSGMVMLSRRYAISCVASDSQLIGGFLAALLIFMRNSQSSEDQCAWEQDGQHKLKDIGMSCSRWFINGLDDYTVALLIPNDSPLITESKYNLIHDISEKIISSFVLFTTFGLADNLDSLRDLGGDFGNSVDAMIFESLSDYLEGDVQFEVGGETELFDSSIF